MDTLPQSPLAKLYGFGGRLLTPLAPFFLAYRAQRGKEMPARRSERLGHSARARPKGALIWIHAASIGEALSALTLIDRLTVETGATVLFTTGTATSAKVLGERLPEGAFHQFVPFDLPGPVERFLDQWRPDLALFVESEIWPTCLRACKMRDIPLGLVNGRMSERSHRRWIRFGRFARTVFDAFDIIVAQTADHASRLGDIVGRTVPVGGNMKFDTPPPPVSSGDLAAARARVGARPVFAAVSTHAGEDAAIFEAIGVLRRHFPDLLAIVAPRHPERGDAVMAAAAAAGLVAARRSAGQVIEETTALWLFDTVGEIGLVYALADIAFCGGSLIAHGGQNPIEPVRAGVPVLHGPHVFNFAEIYSALNEKGATLVVEGGASDIAEAVVALLHDNGRRVGMAGAAAEALAGFSGATERTLALLEPYLPRT